MPSSLTAWDALHRVGGESLMGARGPDGARSALAVLGGDRLPTALTHVDIRLDLLARSLPNAKALAEQATEFVSPLESYSMATAEAPALPVALLGSDATQDRGCRRGLLLSLTGPPQGRMPMLLAVRPMALGSLVSNITLVSEVGTGAAPLADGARP